MSAESLKALVNALRLELVPTMSRKDFLFDARSRTFRRALPPCTQIVNIQVGVRSLEGRFTVNLGVYHPTYCVTPVLSAKGPLEYDCIVRERLGCLRKRVLFPPRDKWWRFSAKPAETLAQVALARDLLLEKGFEWLDSHTDVTLLAATFAKLKPHRSAQPAAESQQ